MLSPAEPDEEALPNSLGIANAEHSSESPKSEPLLCSEDHPLDFASGLTLREESGKPPERVYREVILVTVAVFMGYASLVVVQKKLFDRFEANHGGTLSDLQSEIFEHGTSLVYFGNLCFRLLHNVVFAKLTPRHRVVLSLGLMAVAMSILVAMYFVARSKWVGWVYIAYLCGGVAIGSFESNLLSTITPLGPDTKVWAIIGMPVGFTFISVVGYAAMAVLRISVVFLYIATAIMSLLGIAIWIHRVPIPPSYNQQDFRQFWSNLRAFREWLPRIRVHALCLTVDMFMVSFFSAINQYILDGDRLPLFGGSALFLNTNTFFSIYSIGTFVGDTAGRKIIYYFSLGRVHPSCYLALSVLGAACCLLRVPFAAWTGIFLIFLANGLIYAASTKFIDRSVDKTYSLTAISVWLFVGDIGSVTGSNLWQFFEPMVCRHSHSKYLCVGNEPTPSPTNRVHAVAGSLRWMMRP